METKVKKKLKSRVALILAFIMIFSSISCLGYSRASEEPVISEEQQIIQAPAEELPVPEKEKNDENVEINEEELKEKPEKAQKETEQVEETDEKTKVSEETDEKSNVSDGKKKRLTDPIAQNSNSDLNNEEIESNKKDLDKASKKNEDNPSILNNDYTSDEKASDEIPFDRMYNPDHLTQRHIERESENANAGLIQYFSVIQPRSFTGASSANEPETSKGVIGRDHPANPGDVMVFKEAKPVEGMLNTWDITLRIEGKDTKKTSDIVLVMDKSGSMGDYSRMIEAKKAAKAFVEKLLPSNNTRIGLVSFADEVEVNSGLTSEASVLNSKIDGLRAYGGTFTQAGIKQAQAMLESSKADYKHIVLLSDGEPTYSYKIFNPDNYLENQYINEASIENSNRIYNVSGQRKATTSQVPESEYSNTRVGKGFAMFHRYYKGWFNNDYFYNHGNSTIAQAGFAKSKNQSVWSIALSAGNLGEGVLRNVSSPGKYYTSTPSELNNIFQNIAGSIASAAKDAKVEDPMGIGFEVANVSSISATQGNHIYKNGRIDWNPGSLTKPIEEGGDIKYAELKYRVEINDDILSQTPNENGEYPTNGDAKVTYLDVEGNENTIKFPKPTVNPVLYTVEKELQDEDGNVIPSDNLPDESFKVKVTGTEYDKTYELNPKSGLKTKVLTSLRISQTYKFEETGFDSSKYEVKYFLDGKEAEDKSFTINDSSNDVKIKVVNKLKSTPVDVEKIVTGNMGDREKRFQFSYKIEKNGKVKSEGNFELKHEQKYSQIESKMLNVPYGAKITITELDAIDYDTTVTNVKGNSKVFTWINEGNQEGFTVRFTNDKTDVVPTGISDNQAPMVAALSLTLTAGLAMLISKKKKTITN